MSLQAGTLNRRITILKHSRAYDTHNQPIEAWTNVAEVAASWLRASANERLASGQVGSQASDIFEIRWSPTVSGLSMIDRIGYKGRTYDIVDVAEIGIREGLTISAMVRTD